MSLCYDCRHAVRLVRKAPWFTTASALVLALGIGATTAMFSLVDAALLRPLPFGDAHQLVMLWERSPQNARGFVSFETFADWRDSATTLTGQIVEQVKRAIARVDPTQAVSQVRTIEQVAEQSTARPRLRAQLVVAFAALATLLAAAGIFSVLTFMVQQRAREFSVRLAVGASAGKLLRFVLADGLKLTAIGVAVGVVASAALVRSLSALLFGVPPLDPLTFVAAPITLIIVALLACVAPALRVLRTDPVTVLRSE